MAQQQVDTTCPTCRRDIAAPVLYATNPHEGQQYFICKCPRGDCETHFFVVWVPDLRRVAHVFPHPYSGADAFHEAIPLHIREDHAEAWRCFHAGAYKGTVVMCRREMQSIAVHQNATGRRLFDQIRDLFDKGTITKSLKDAAHGIRFFGNFGAHPSDDLLDNIAQEDARTVLSLVHGFLVDLYIRPHEVEQLTGKGP